MNGIPPLSSRDAHASPPQRVLERLHSSAAGLDADEAARRLAAHGYNRLPAPKRQGPLLRLLRQFHNVLLYMMLFASLVTALLGFWVDSAVILLAVVVNALIGFVQEGKAANALDAIRDMLSLHALVLRDGQRQALDAERLVPGDVVLLASGDRVPADLRLFETKNFHVDESALTGESVPVEKGCVAVAIDALLGDRRCMAYSGTLVTSGQARGVVVATAGDTELGRIGTLLREVRTLATPLLRQIASFSRWLALAILLLAGATFVLGTLWQGQPMVDMFMLVVALTASAIPEGLPAIMTVILALGVQRMARRNAIVSRLPAVETLGSVTVICSDKTGTLTRNEMTVQRIVTADQVIEVSGAGYAPLGGFSHNGEGLDPAGRDDLQEIGRAALLCNEARLHQEGEAWQLEGDPTEGALLSLGLKLGLDPQALAAERPRSDAIPFESEHRFMATLHHDHAGQAMVYLKGAPERILDMCEAERVGDSVRSLDPDYWRRLATDTAARGLRLLAIARRARQPGQAEEFPPADGMGLAHHLVERAQLAAQQPAAKQQARRAAGQQPVEAAQGAVPQARQGELRMADHLDPRRLFPAAHDQRVATLGLEIHQAREPAWHRALVMRLHALDQRLAALDVDHPDAGEVAAVEDRADHQLHHRRVVHVRRQGQAEGGGGVLGVGAQLAAQLLAGVLHAADEAAAEGDDEEQADGEEQLLEQ